MLGRSVRGEDVKTRVQTAVEIRTSVYTCLTTVASAGVICHSLAMTSVITPWQTLRTTVLNHPEDNCPF